MGLRKLLEKTALTDDSFQNNIVSNKLAALSDLFLFYNPRVCGMNGGDGIQQHHMIYLFRKKSKIFYDNIKNKG